jgi:hypothetical protein
VKPLTIFIGKKMTNEFVKSGRVRHKPENYPVKGRKIADCLVNCRESSTYKMRGDDYIT